VAQKGNLSFKNRFPYISVKDEASDFKFGKQLGFAKAHHQIPLGLGELPEIWGFHFDISAMAEASVFNLAHSLVFAKAHYKITPCAVGAPQNFGTPL